MIYRANKQRRSSDQCQKPYHRIFIKQINKRNDYSPTSFAQTLMEHCSQKTITTTTNKDDLIFDEFIYRPARAANVYNYRENTRTVLLVQLDRL